MEQRQSVDREREGYRLEVVACNAQIDSMSEVLHRQDSMLAEKVSMEQVGGGGWQTGNEG